MKKEYLGIIQILIAGVLFSFVPILVRFGIDIGVYNLSFYRVVIAAFSIYLFIILTGKNLIKPKYEKKQLFIFGFLHGLTIVAYYIAVKYLSIASAILLLYSSSIWMVIFSYFILKERISYKIIIALVLAFSGVLIVTFPGSAIRQSVFGIITGLLAGISFGYIYIISKTFKRYDKISLSFWQNIISIPFLIPLIFIELPNFTLNNLFILILLGTVCTAVPFILVYKGFEKVKGQLGGILILLETIFPIIFAIIFLNEIPNIYEIFGGVLIIFGSIIATREL